VRSVIGILEASHQATLVASTLAITEIHSLDRIYDFFEPGQRPL
jgi:hypothetical protein